MAKNMFVLKFKEVRQQGIIINSYEVLLRLFGRQVLLKVGIRNTYEVIKLSRRGWVLIRGTYTCNS